jgi:hypothetical protein
MNNSYCCTIPLSTDMFLKLHAMDKELVGTEDYMGFAYFWGQEVKYWLREFTYKQRKTAHDALIDAGIELKDNYFEDSPEVTAIIEKLAIKFNKY